MAIKGGRIGRFIQIKFLRPLRLRAVINILEKLPLGKILDIGCMDDFLEKRLSRKFDYLGIDEEPFCENNKIIRKSVKDLKKGEKYDIVIATEVLEHLDDPVDAIRTLKSLTKRYILISVPYEPFFSIFRMFLPAKEHLWTIFPQTLKKHLGKPVCERLACFNRTYIALWDLKRNKPISYNGDKKR